MVVVYDVKVIESSSEITDFHSDVECTDRLMGVLKFLIIFSTSNCFSVSTLASRGPQFHDNNSARRQKKTNLVFMTGMKFFQTEGAVF